MGISGSRQRAGYPLQLRRDEQAEALPTGSLIGWIRRLYQRGHSGQITLRVGFFADKLKNSTHLPPYGVDLISLAGLVVLRRLVALQSLSAIVS